MTETENKTEVVPEETPEAVELTPELQKQIMKQIEYYYGDFNLPRDRFLRQQVDLDEGWVPLDLMMKFTRLCKLAVKAENIAASFEALGSELLELSEDKTKVRRLPSKPIPVYDEELQKESQKRTVYCKGFPLDETLDNLMEYFAQYGKSDTIQMRTYREKSTNAIKFKGSVFIVFKTVELAESFMKLESVKFKDTELIRKWQADYNEEKRLERQEKFNKSGKKAKKEEVEKPEEIELPTGCILKVSGVSSEVTREDIKAELQEKCEVTVAFIEFNKGDEAAWVRLQGKDSAAKAVEKLEGGKLKVLDVELTVETLTPEEEEPKLAKAKEFINNRRNNQNKGPRRGGKRRGGGRGNWRDSKRARVDAD